MTWAKKNVAVIVTWALLLLGGAVGVGVHVARMDALTEKVDELAATVTKNTEATTKLGSSIAVLEALWREKKR